MSSYITNDLHQVYVEEVFKPKLGKPGASTPAKSTFSSDLDGDGETDLFEKKVRQFIYDVRHLMRKNNIPVERAFQIRSSKTNYGAEVIKTAKEKLGIKGGGVAPVSEEKGHEEKLYSIVIRYKNGTSYRKRTSRSEISRLRSNPNVSSVEMTKYGVDGIAKKDYDGDGKIESGSKEHAGAVHNAIQRKMGGTPDGQDTRGKSSKKKLKGYGVSEGFSNWRQDLKEVIGVDDEIASRNEKQIKEKKVDNYKDKTIVINPQVTEEVEIFGGRIVESFELSEEYIEEVVNIATNFFFNCGLNENGVDIVIEELGEDKFAEFVFDLSEEYFLSEARTLLGKKKVAKKLPTGTKPSQTTKARVEKGGQTIKSQSVKGTIGKKITASKAKDAVEKAKETQAPSSEKTSEGKKKGIAGKLGAALGAVVKKGREDIKRVQDAAQTAKTVASRRGAEAKAVYDAVRERGKKAEQSAAATRARRKATVAAGRAVQAAAPVAKKAVKAAAGAAGAGAGSLKAGKSPAAAAGRAAGTFVRKMKEEIELQEKSESEQQQKLFGLALSVKRGETPRSEASAEVLKIVNSMSEKEIRKFAATPHKGIPKKKVNEAIANPEGVTDTKSPLITRIQKGIANKQIKNAQDRLGEDLQPTTPQQFSAERQVQAALKRKQTADATALKLKQRQQKNQQEPQQQVQKNSYELEGNQIDETTPLFYKLQKIGKGLSTPTGRAQTRVDADLQRQKNAKMKQQRSRQKQKRESEYSHSENPASWPRPQA